MFNGAYSTSRPLEIGRGLAILAVMYGHALAPWFMDAGAHFSAPAYLQWKFGASFVMPFFFFLSGVAWRAERSLAVTARQSLTLVLITLSASMAFDVVRVGLTLSGAAPALGIVQVDPLGYVRHALKMTALGSDYSMGALWFLTALAVARLLAAMVTRTGRVAAAVFALALLALSFGSTAWGWINFYQLNLIGVAFAFFLAGRWARDVWTRAAAAPLACLAAAVASGVAAAASFDLNHGCRWDVFGECGVGWLNGGFGVAMIHGQFGNLALFMFTAAAGVAFAAALSMLLARLAAGELLARVGRNSLNLLIVNCIFLQLLNPVLARYVAPRLPADNALFFGALFVATLVLNLATARVLRHPLRRLRGLASAAANTVWDWTRQIFAPVIVAGALPRVSQAHAKGRAKRWAL